MTNRKTIFVFSEKNRNILDYCQKHSYSYLVTNDTKNILYLLETFLYTHDYIVIVQNHVRWISEEEFNISLEGKAFAICKWDLGVICLDLRHADIKKFIQNYREKKEFWTTWNSIKTNVQYKESSRPKKKLRKLLCNYPFKNYNEIDNWNAFNFNGKYTKIVDYNDTKFTYSTSISTDDIKIAIATIILPRIELPWLNEWINHHKRLGVSKIIIYNNGLKSNDTQYGSEDTKSLNDYMWAKKPNAYYVVDKEDDEIIKELYNIADIHKEVEIREWVQGVNHEYSYPESQMQMVYDASKNLRYKWLFIDPDEYLQLHNHSTLQGYLIESNEHKHTSLRIGSKLFEERKVGKPVSQIRNWSINEKLRKCLISGEVLKGSTIHQIDTTSKQHKVASRQDIEIYHYCGNPLKHKDTIRKIIYEEQGSPPFTNVIKDKKLSKIITFIFTWDGQYENAKKLENELRKYSDVFVINSDTENQEKKWINIPANSYFSKQMLTALNAFRGDIFAHIQADCKYDNWKEVYKQANLMLSNTEAGIYAPNIDYTSYKPEIVDIRAYKEQIKYVATTDESAWFIHKEIIDKCKEYRYLFEGNEFGYGWDLIMAGLSWINKKPVLRDYAHTIIHPKGKGYNEDTAKKQMQETIEKAPYELASCIYDIKSNHEKIYSKYIAKENDNKIYTKKFAVVLVATKKELTNGDVRRCLDLYVKNASSDYKIDLLLFFNVGSEEEYEDLRRYEIYPCINRVIIKSHKLSQLDDIYIRTPEEVEQKKVIPSLGASAGANNLFYNTMIPLMDEDYDQYLMIETDSKPLRTDWIDKILKYIDTHRYLIAGSQYKGTLTLPDYEVWTGHLNGIALYKKSKKLKYLLHKSREYIKYQVQYKEEYFLSFDCAIHMYICTKKGMKRFKNVNTPWNWLVNSSIITNMSLPCDKNIEINEVLKKFPKTIILHQKFK